jgi:acyl-CoA thioesterase-1
VIRRWAQIVTVGAAVIGALVASACSGGGDRVPTARSAPASAPAGPVAAAPVSRPSRPRIVVLGDSLTVGLGLQATDAYPSLLQRRLDAGGYEFEVVNAGVSGDTSAGGLTRLEWSLDGDVRILIVALGGNDGLRGLPPDEMKRNLGEIIRRARAHDIAVLLAGMESLTNMGPDYQRRFHDVFPSLAREQGVSFLPFLLEGVAGRADLNQNDGIHPTAEGARIIADHVWAALEPMARAASR